MIVVPSSGEGQNTWLRVGNPHLGKSFKSWSDLSCFSFSNILDSPLVVPQENEEGFEQLWRFWRLHQHWESGITGGQGGTMGSVSAAQHPLILQAFPSSLLHSSPYFGRTDQGEVRYLRLHSPAIELLELIWSFPGQGHSKDGRECFDFWSFWDELWGGSCLLSEELVKFLVRCAVPLKMHYLFSKLNCGCWLRVFKILL